METSANRVKGATIGALSQPAAPLPVVSGRLVLRPLYVNLTVDSGEYNPT
jgi:hypothetical protein